MQRSIEHKLTELRSCPHCNSKDFEIIETSRDLQFYIDRSDGAGRVTVSHVSCNQCGLLFMNPAYTDDGFELLFEYAGRSYGDGGGRHSEQLAWLEQNDCLHTAKSFMDIGCFEGDFLSSLPKGKRLLGIDYDIHAIERAKRKPGLKNAQLMSGKFESFRLDEAIDVFTMFHVLEHLREPHLVLKRLNKHSHADTRLIIEVPILEKGATRDIHGFYSPQHLTHFSKRTLAQTLNASGWQIESEQVAVDYNGYRISAKPILETIELDQRWSGDDYLSVCRERVFHYESRGRLAEKMNALKPTEHIYIWGAGMHLEMLYHRSPLFRWARNSKVSLIDSDELKIGKLWRGYEINAPAFLTSVDWNSGLLFVSSYGGQESIAKAATEYGVPSEKIIKLYDNVMSY